MTEIENFPYLVKVPMKGADRKTKIYFWLWEHVGDCPKMPKGMRSRFGETSRQMKTKDIRWRYITYNGGEFRFVNKSEAVLFRLKWAD